MRAARRGYKDRESAGDDARNNQRGSRANPPQVEGKDSKSANCSIGGNDSVTWSIWRYIGSTIASRASQGRIEATRLA